MSFLKPIFQAASRLGSAIARTFHHILETERNVQAAITHPGAMPEHQRHLDEFKLASGGVLMGAGTLELNPLAIAGGTIPAWEALHELEVAGHKWRLRHPQA